MHRVAAPCRFQDNLVEAAKAAGIVHLPTVKHSNDTTVTD